MRSSIASRRRILAALVATAVAGGLGAASPAEKCGQAKIKALTKLVQCRTKADLKALKKGQEPDYEKCGASFTTKWQKAEGKAAGECPTSGDASASEELGESQSLEIAVRALSTCSVLDQDCPGQDEACYMSSESGSGLLMG